MGLLSLINDLYLYIAARELKLHPLIPMVMYASLPQGGLILSARTLSNSIEAILVSFFLLLIQSTKITSHRSFLIFLQTFILALGFFLRPTFILFVFWPSLLQIHHMVTTYKLKHFAQYVLIGIAGLLLSCYSLVRIDSNYYMKKWVMAPINFLAYNWEPKNLAQHGIHPRYLHLIVNLPLLILNPVAFLYLLQRPTKATFHLLCSVLVPLAALSLFQHQESRFLLPIVPQLCLILSQNWQKSRSRSAFVTIWIVYSLVHFLFWGYLHQGGLLKMAQLIHSNPSECRDFHFWKTYMMPRFLLDNVSVHDLGGIPSDQLYLKFNESGSKCVNLIGPCLFADAFGMEVARASGHVWTEDFKEVWDNFSLSVFDMCWKRINL
ncbi:hypothetical protein Ciccas_005422 [Cichlidogyrus casuarinus]|uniref:Mannosyltransferase n=1 Tax=Cichlidogyrus casuarinus TaxID=1844966 RepID=A0ABD2Q8N4_9PLAT